MSPEELQLNLKETPTQVFYCEYCEIFKNAYFEKYLQTAASDTIEKAIPSSKSYLAQPVQTA